MFATIPCYSIQGSAVEDHIVNLSTIEDIKPHADIDIDGVPTSSCEATYSSGNTIIILLDMGTLQQRLTAITGTFDVFGQPLL